MTKDELFEWVQENTPKYPVLSELVEEQLDEFTFILRFPAKFGVQDGLILTFDKDLAVELRRRENYAVTAVENYAEAQKWIAEIAEFSRIYQNKKGNENT